MTDPGAPNEPAEVGEPASEAPGRPSPPSPPSPADTRPGLRTFTIEGRAAPGLFVGGWIATLLGLAIVFPGLASGSVPAPLLFVGFVLLAAGLIAGSGSQAIERRARGAAFSGPSPFLLFAAVVAAVVVLVIVVLFLLSFVGFSPGDSPAAALVSQLVLLVTYAGLVRLTVVGTGAASWRELGFRMPDEPASAIAFGAIIAVPLVFISSVLAVILLRFLPAPPSPLPEATDPAGLVLNLVAAAVVAPIGEELFFRGYATTAWLRTLGPMAAIVRGGLFFAFAHVLTLTGSSEFASAAGQALVAFAIRVPVAFALGWLFVRTRSIYPTIALHATFNGLPLLFTLLRV